MALTYGDLLYALPTDQVADLVTPTLDTGTANASYPLVNIYSGDPAKPFYTTTTGDVRITWDFGTGKQRIDGFSLANFKIPAGTLVKFQGNSANSWGVPGLNASITIPAAGEDGLPMPTWKDLRTVNGYAASGWRYWSLFVPNPGQTTALAGVGLWARLRELDRHVQHGYQEIELHPSIVHATDYGKKFRYSLNTRLRQLLVHFRSTDSDTAALRSLIRSTKGSLSPFLWIQDQGVNDAWLAMFQDGLNVVNTFQDVRDMDLVIEELARGMPL